MSMTLPDTVFETGWNDMTPAAPSAQTPPGYELFAGYPDLLSPAHLADITGQCEATMRAMCAKGDLPAVKVGKRWYVPKPAMVELVMGARGHA